MLITLPGTTSAFTEANIFARASGYIDKRNVDIGDRVKKGQLLAQITAPELDHQIAQAEATLSQTRGHLAPKPGQCGSRECHLAARQAAGRERVGDPATGRYRTGSGSRHSRPTVGVAQSNVAAQQAQISVLQQQKDYQSVVAPFDGVVTQRNIDVGSLVQADATSGTFMFTVMQDNVIRTQVYVPQDQAFGLGAGRRGGGARSRNSRIAGSPAR